MAVHNSSAAKIRQNKLRIDCATSSNFVNNLIDLNGQNVDVTIDRAKTVTTHAKSCSEHVNMSVVNNTAGSTPQKIMTCS